MDKQKKPITLMKLLTITFLIGLGITLYIIYSGIDNAFVNRFVIYYVVFMLFYALYACFKLLVNFAKLDGSERKRIVISFFKYLIITILLMGTSMYLLKKEIIIYKLISLGLGTAIGITYIEVVRMRILKP